MKKLRYTNYRHACSSSYIALAAALQITLVGACLAQAATSPQTASKPVWPDNGVAQRMFPNGSTMFVDNDHGKLRAWVLSETTGGKDVEALDFFSGLRMKVKVDLEEDGRQDQSFTDAQGGFHSTVGREFAFSGTSLPIDLPGISFDGNTIHLSSVMKNCYVNITAISPTKNYVSGQDTASTWSKFAIYHSVSGPRGCASGAFDSKITSALDLSDGTFLAIEGCFVFRLRKSDLSPAGSAPALRIIDESMAQAAINQAKGKNIQDATAYIAEVLHLPTAPEISCKED